MEAASRLAQQHKLKRHVNVFFDANDEFVTESLMPELHAAELTLEDLEKDIPDFEDQEKRAEFIKTVELVQEVIQRKYHNIVLFLGDEKFKTSGTTKLTREIFQGTNSRTENAKLFLENLERVKHIADPTKRSKFDPGFAKRGEGSVTDFSGETAVHSSDYEREANMGPISETFDFSDDEDEVVKRKREIILNLAPSKNDKPKDKLFTNFFYMYTKDSVKQTAQAPDV